MHTTTPTAPAPSAAEPKPAPAGGRRWRAVVLGGLAVTASAVCVGLATVQPADAPVRPADPVVVVDGRWGGPDRFDPRPPELDAEPPGSRYGTADTWEHRLAAVG